MPDETYNCCGIRWNGPAEMVRREAIEHARTVHRDNPDFASLTDEQVLAKLLRV